MPTGKKGKGKALGSQLVPFRVGKPRAKAAIVFVHGFSGETAATWGEFPGLLGRDRRLGGWDILGAGYDTHLRIDVTRLWTADPDLDKVALKLRTDARTGALAPYRGLCLIAHSMGGLVVQRALLSDPALRDRTSHVFLFGTPSGGLRKASLIRWLKPQLRDMGRGGRFIRELRADWDRRFSAREGKRLPFRFHTVCGTRDEFVPSESSLDPFPEDAYPDCRFAVPGDHLEIVKPDSSRHPSIQLVVRGILGDAAPAGPWNSARVAVESCDFRRAVDELFPHRDELDQEGVVLLALALEQTGREEEAVKLLTRRVDRVKGSTDAMGVLAGRLKRRWLLTRRDVDAKNAMDLYSRALSRAVESDGDAAQCYYHGINLAFFEVAYRNRIRAARKRAREVLEFCRQAEETERRVDRKWRLATEGEAHLILGDFAKALSRYREAAEPAQEASPRELESMFQQARYLSKLVGNASTSSGLTRIFRHDEGGDA